MLFIYGLLGASLAVQKRSFVARSITTKAMKEIDIFMKQFWKIDDD